jgi:protoporphyrinogen oxidase
VGRIIIIGAGPTGLGAAWRLEERGHDAYLVLEAGAGPGGLAASHVDEAGFTWDMGGHVQFSHYRYYDDVLDRALGDAWLWHRRDAAVRVCGVDIPYPLQHHVESLPAPWRDRVRASIPDATATPCATFDEWLLTTFGAPLHALFFAPYNAKVWQHPLGEMQSAWVAERVAIPAQPGTAQAWGPNATFRYPARGGTGAIWTAVAALVPSSRQRYLSPVMRIDARRRRLWLGDDTVHDYDALVSAVPLDALVALIDGLPEHVREAAQHLVANTVELVGIGVGVPLPERLRGRSWQYFPEPESPYYRVTVLSNYSPAMAPDAGCYSLLTESSRARGASIDVADLVARTRAALVRDGLLDAGAPTVSHWHRTLERGYPVPTLSRDGALAAIHGTLQPLGIFSRGRFGGWKYEVSNQDHAFMQGVEIADLLLDGTPEVTYPETWR